jgi:hypothetical protein
MSDYYTESQVNRIEQDAHDGAILEAGKEWERQRDESNAREHELETRIAELEAERRWIPVSERLPLLRDGKAVLVYTKSGEIYSGLYLGNNEWTGLLHDFREGDVTHWMPLPETPENK